MYKQFEQYSQVVIWVAVLALTAVGPVESAVGYTPESPEVKASVAQALKFLETEDADDHRVGARALVGLVLVKRGFRPDHPRIIEAVSAIRKALGDRDPTKVDFGEKGVYHAGLVAMFLVAHDYGTHRADIECVLKHLQLVQKDHGGWGYPQLPTGDTSMTQYGVLSAWEATQAGFRVPPESIERVATWLLRTQDPSGAFGYQGTLSPNFTPVKQDTTSLSMGAAGLGSLLICADMLGLTPEIEAPQQGELPPSLQKVQDERPAGGAGQPKTRLDPRLFQAAEGRGSAWLGANFRPDPPMYAHYYLYALERCMAFRSLWRGKIRSASASDGLPWYDKGVEHLLKTQQADGSWKGNCGVAPDTAFAVLFLIRSTHIEISKARNFGDGRLLGGRGIPKQTGRAQVRDGKVVVKPLVSEADELMEILAGTDTPDYSQAADLVAELPLDQAQKLVKQHVEKLRRLTEDESPQARMAAVRALSKTGDLDHVPTLIFALTDPDAEIAIEARDGLRRIGRNSAGFGLPARPSPAELQAAIGKWKAWYLEIRPDAELED